MQIRPALPSDKEAIFPLAKALATSFVVDQDSFSKTWDSLPQYPQTCLLVAEDGGQICGYLLGLIRPAFHANAPAAWVDELFVTEALRRQGIGKSLLQAFEAWAATQGAVLVDLATSRAGKFYEALGYKETAAYFKKY